MDDKYGGAARGIRAALRLLPGTVCSAAIMLGLLSQSERRAPGQDTSERPPAGRGAEVRAAVSGQPISIRIDATASSGQDPEALKSICARLRQLTGVQPPEMADPDPAQSRPTTPDWYLWAQLGSQCSLHTASSNPDNVVGVYAAHTAECGSVCLWNQSAGSATCRLSLKLRAGVYRFERLSFVPSGASAKLAADAATAPVSSLKRLEGVDCGVSSVVNKQIELAPGEAAIIRYVDEARTSRLQLMNVKEELHNLAQSTPGPAARLRRIIAESDKYSSLVSEGDASTRQRRLNGIHRVILVVSQAESLHRNYQIRQSVNAAPGARTMGALERLADSLAETSAILTGLVPQIEIGAITHLAGSTQAPAGQEMIEAVVTVSVRNTGDHSVDALKLGMDASALPAGSACTPDDPAFFGELRPGQAARAEFKLKMPAAAHNDFSCVAADVSYFASGAPAHLRPRPW